MDPLPATVVRTESLPLLARQADDSWVLEFADAGVAVLLTTEQVRHAVDDFLAQQLGGPFED
jgi:hypothetical protein